ncbi:MAG: hypothetical protein RL346_488 [Verrucomicrobiota bacterium]|jgi:hypothetical protein
MEFESVSKPFLHAWLSRTRKQLSVSGRLSELALILSREHQQVSEHEWRIRLNAIFMGDEEPDMELLTRIDSLLARPSEKMRTPDKGEMLL